MTHSLHRQGPEKSLQNDYVFLCTPSKGINDRGAKEKILRVLDIVMAIGPSNIGFYGHGSLLNNVSIADVKENLNDNSRVRCSFDSIDKIKEAFRLVKSEDLGLSITVSGLTKELKEISLELGLKPHTINISCGYYGKINRLPSSKVLELSTMCGHGMIGFGLVQDIIRKLKRGDIESKNAVHQLGEPCTCGIFNPTRAREILADVLNQK
jgi:hypothetical protein